MSEEGIINVDEGEEIFPDGDEENDQESDHVSEHGEDMRPPLQEAWVPTEAEKDYAARYVEPGKKPRAAKQPRSPLVEYLEERPDLAAYFDGFAMEIPPAERIKMCRAYASYLASLQPPKPKAQKRARK